MLHKKFTKVVILGGLSWTLFACDMSQTYRDAVAKENDLFTQAKADELKPAEGSYSGVIHVSQTGNDYDCLLDLWEARDTTRIGQSQDQTETVEVPKLAGGMHFPALDKATLAEIPSFSDITKPMGGYLKVIINFGDYNPRTKELVLPYRVPGYPLNLGLLKGELVNGQYTGKWTADDYVGTFEFTLNPEAQK